MSRDPLARGLVFALCVGGLFAQAPVTETLIRDLNLQPGTQRYGSGARVLEATASRLWFSAFSPFEGNALWTTDGTPRNTRLHSDVSPGPGTGEFRGGVTLPNGRFLTMAQSSVFGLEPFVSDPAQPGLQVLVDLVPGAAGSDASAPVKSARSRLAPSRIAWVRLAPFRSARASCGATARPPGNQPGRRGW